MNDTSHLLRLWTLGTLVIMVTVGGLTGSLLRHWDDRSLAAMPTPYATAAGIMLVLGLMTVWFMQGYRLWKSAQAA